MPLLKMLSNGTHRLKTKGKAMQRECSNGDGGERVQVIPTGKSTIRQNEVEECYQWPILLSGVKDRVIHRRALSFLVAFYQGGDQLSM